MRAGIAFGMDHLEIDVEPGRLVEARRAPEAAPLADPAAAVAAALEAPLGFPPLRRALTPDDHVAIVIDEHLPHLAALLTPILEHLARALITPEAVTLVCAPPALRQEWVDDLPDVFEEVRVEVHDPGERKRLAYLATTKKGHRIYVNRTVVDADQVVVLTGRGYDPLLGYGGGEGALFPALSDAETVRKAREGLSLAPPEGAWPLRREAAEVAWLLGAPFFVQVVAGAGEDVAHVVAGPVQSGAEALRLLDARWRVAVDAAAETVVAGVGGDPAGHNFAALARALACAARVVKPGGRIVLLSGGEPELGPGADLLRRAEEPEAALRLLREQAPPDWAAVFQWASAARQATVYLLSGLADEVAEELFAVPLQHAGEARRLPRDGSCLLLGDADKTMALVQGA
jgi:nickel-dependent lactate racemase